MGISHKNAVHVRAGLPQPYGRLISAAHEAGIPVLFSANAFAKARAGKQPGETEFGGFNLSAASKIPADLDAALDSAGFVAANRYGGYRWTVQQYYDLVEARNWTWHAAMDYCMEPQVAGSKLVRMIRLNATVQGHLECVNEAKRRGAPLPMPVLQGWMPEDYLRCADRLTVEEWPTLVGLGSVCRRNLYGEDGIAKIVEAIDRVMPPHVKLHLFGVKGGAIKEFGDHPRVGSIDSMAWDFSVRCKHRTGRTQEMRAQAMTSWQIKQSSVQPDRWSPTSFLRALDAVGIERPPTQVQSINRVVSDWFADNLGDHGYRELSSLITEQAQMIAMKVQHFGVEALADTSDMVEMAVYDDLRARMAA